LFDIPFAALDNLSEGRADDDSLIDSIAVNRVTLHMYVVSLTYDLRRPPLRKILASCPVSRLHDASLACGTLKQRRIRNSTWQPDQLRMCIRT